MDISKFILSMANVSSCQRAYYAKRGHYNAKSKVRYYERKLEAGEELSLVQQMRYASAALELRQHPNRDFYNREARKAAREAKPKKPRARKRVVAEEPPPEPLENA